MDFTYYAQMKLNGVGVERIAPEFKDWVFGKGRYAKIRGKRLELGVRPEWPPREWPPRADLHGDHDCQLSLRQDDGAFLLRWVHRDSTLGHILWHNIVRVSAADGGAIVEHGVARSAPRDTVLDPVATCPRVLASLIEIHGAHVQPKELCTGKVTEIGPGDVSEYAKYILLDRHRVTPIVLVTPAKDGGEVLVDAEGLARSLVGMASVAVIRDKTGTFGLANAFSERGFDRTFTCFDGGVRIYEAPLLPTQDPYQHRLWLRRRIENIAPDQRQGTVAGEIASRLVARRMPWGFRGAIERFDQAQKRRGAEAFLASMAAGGASAVVVDAERDAKVAELTQQLQEALKMQDYFSAEHSRAEEELAAATENVERLQRERDERSYLFQDLQRRFNDLKAERATEGVSAELAEAVTASLRGTNTVEQALTVVAALFGDRIVVLDSARQSAKRSAEFKFPDRVLRLLLDLAGPYWEALATGKGDTEARKVFGTSYAPCESEAGEGNKRARSLRTFQYEGLDVEMFQHLKYGTKDSVHETWRTYFTWVPESQRIVIGHCGPHLDLR